MLTSARVSASIDPLLVTLKSHACTSLALSRPGVLDVNRAKPTLSLDLEKAVMSQFDFSSWTQELQTRYYLSALVFATYWRKHLSPTIGNRNHTSNTPPFFPEEVHEMVRRRAARSHPRLLSDNLLVYGDNLRVLRESPFFRDESVDLVYLDPPFKHDEKYNVLFRAKSGTPAAAQVRAFEDTWHWDTEPPRVS